MAVSAFKRALVILTRDVEHDSSESTYLDGLSPVHVLDLRWLRSM